MKGPYDDIIGLPHPVSKKHPPMSIHDRAAQFSPFAALSGYDSAIRETARLTGHRVELYEDTKAELDMKLRMAAGGEEAEEWRFGRTEDGKEDGKEVAVTYFQPDPSKEGGSYETVTGRIKKIDDYRRMVVFEDGKKIPMDDIVEIEGDFL